MNKSCSAEPAKDTVGSSLLPPYSWQRSSPTKTRQMKEPVKWATELPACHPHRWDMQLTSLLHTTATVPGWSTSRDFITPPHVQEVRTEICNANTWWEQWEGREDCMWGHGQMPTPEPIACHTEKCFCNSSETWNTQFQTPTPLALPWPNTAASWGAGCTWTPRGDTKTNYT